MEATDSPTSAAIRPEPALHRHAVLVVVGIGTLLSAMASSTVNLALPAIGREFVVPIDRAGWVLLAFLVTVTALLLVAGRLGDLVGHRAVYLAGSFLFGTGSLLCGLSPGLAWLLAARVVQGAGGAMAMAAGPALLTTTFPGAQRGRALGMLATATYTGLTLGPPLGGVILAAAGWRWLFHLNVPVMALVLALGWRFLPRHARRAALRFDWAGAATLLPGLPLLLLALAQGPRWGWGARGTLAAAAGGTLLLAAFLRTQAHREAPLLRLALFRSADFSGATASALANYVALFIPAVLVPFYLLDALRLSPSRAGLVLSAQPLIMALVASPSGWLSDRLGRRGLAAGGMVLLTLGMLGLSTVGPAEPVWRVAVWLGGIGLGTGIFISPNSSALMGAAPRDLQGTAGGVMAVARTLGMMIGVAVGTSVFHLAGGHGGGAWTAADYRALRAALLVAAAVSLAGAVTSSWPSSRRAMAPEGHRRRIADGEY